MSQNATSQPSRSRTVSSLRQSRRLHFLRAGLVGLLAAAVAIFFKQAIDLIGSTLSSVGEWSSSSILNSLSSILFVTCSGLVAGYLTQAIAPEASGSGIPHVKAVLLHLRELRFLRLMPVKFFAGALAIGSGFSLGREGPTVHLGAAVADGVANVLKIPGRSRNHLIACGAGAGLAAAFNAPLAGFLFVIEELRRELSPITYGAAFIAAVVADGVTRFFTGTSPSLSFPQFSSPTLSTLPIIIAIGAGSAFGGILFNKTVLHGIKKFPTSIPLWQRGAAVGFTLGVCALLIPYSKMGLQETINQFLHPTSAVHFTVLFCFLLFALKFVLTILSYLTGIPGGIFAPMLAQGALLGVGIGRICAEIFPGALLPDGVYGIIGMAAFFSASVRAPLTGVVLIAEMTDNFDLLFLLLVGSLISYLVAELVGEKPIYEALMEVELRKNEVTVHSDPEPVIIDMVVEPHSKFDGIAVREMGLKPGCILITIRKQGRETIPNADSILAQGDELAFLIDPVARRYLFELQQAASSDHNG